MANVTYYVALPFVPADDGYAAGEAVECPSPGAAIRKAETLARQEGNSGAVAFSRTGDPNAGDFEPAVLLKAFGDVPTDFD